MVGHQPEEFNVTHGKQTSNVLRWTLGFFILIIWGALTAYIGYLSAQTVFTKAVIDDLGEVDEVVEELETDDRAVLTVACQDPIFTYSQADVISSIDQEELNDRIIAPLIDFYEDIKTDECSDLVAAIISAVPNDDESFELGRYSIQYILTDGSLGGSILPDDELDVVDWWAPGCSGDCGLSESFYEKYPYYR